MGLKIINIDGLRIATAALSGRIYAGVPSGDNRSFRTAKDVTSDVLKAVVDKAQAMETPCMVVTENGQPKWEIIVRELGKPS